MSTYEIKNLQELLSPVLNQSEFVNASIKKLTAAGENYLSSILSVDVTVRDGQDEKLIRAVAKMLPRNEFLLKMFNSERTFRNEVGYYEVIAPCLRQFQQEQGVTELLSSYPEFYGARFSLDSDDIDENAVLLLKNIKDEGFAILDRKVGFDLEQSKLVLDKMAELHGTFFAFRALRPDVFESEFGGFFNEFQMYGRNDNKADQEAVDQMVCSLLELIEDDEFCSKNLERVKDALLKHLLDQRIKNGAKRQTGNFISFAHCDMWTNNIMVKIVDGKTVGVKIVDYQIYELTSLARDVIFFLFTSVQLPAIQTFCDDLLLYYFKSLVKWLNDLKYDTSHLKFDDFIDEIASVLKHGEFFHIMLMMRPIFILEEDAKEVDELKREDFINKKGALADGCKLRASFIVREFIHRNWI